VTQRRPLTPEKAADAQTAQSQPPHAGNQQNAPAATAESAAGIAISVQNQASRAASKAKLTVVSSILAIGIPLAGRDAGRCGTLLAPMLDGMRDALH